MTHCVASCIVTALRLWHERRTCVQCAEPLPPETRLPLLREATTVWLAYCPGQQRIPLATWPPMAPAMLHAAAARLITGVVDWLCQALDLLLTVARVGVYSSTQLIMMISI